MSEQLWIWPYPGGIEDIGPHDLATADPKLASVAELWRARRKELAQANSLKAFTERLDREFAIETNVIERVFRLDRGVTETLVEHGIKEALIPHGSTDKPVQYVVEIVRSALEATEWLTERFVRDSKPITSFSIKELHQLLTRCHQLGNTCKFRFSVEITKRTTTKSAKVTLSFAIAHLSIARLRWKSL